MEEAFTYKSDDRTSEEKPFRLIFHIGAGKTGTSSIQKTLRDHQERLKKQGFWYLGLMLEYAPKIYFPWQKRYNIAEFFKSSEEFSQAQLADALSLVLPEIKNRGCHTAIWSNEYFFPKSGYVLGALSKIRNMNIDVRIIAYVRRHDAWAWSAYIQWGLKHKGYKGRIKPFEAWSQAWKKKFCFLNDLQPWLENLTQSVFVRNYDAVGDVVLDFFQVADIDCADLSTNRANETPTPEELLLRTLFNDQVGAESPPTNFDRSFAMMDIDYRQSLDEVLNRLMPSSKALEQVFLETQTDRRAISALLEQQGQPPMMESSLDIKPMTPDVSRVVAALARIVMRQSQQITEMRTEIDDLTTEMKGAHQNQASGTKSRRQERLDSGPNDKDDAKIGYAGWRRDKIPAVIVHIGMHKTGSSALQKALYDGLANPVFFYSRISKNHSTPICSLFSDSPENYSENRRRGRNLDQIGDINKEMLARLRDELAEHASKKFIFSGEGITSLKKSSLVNFRRFLVDLFEEIIVVAYVRPPRSFIQSSFQQQLKGGMAKLTIESKYPHYRRIFNKFDHVFGREQVRLWKFDPSGFPGGDVVLDFCQRLDIQIDAASTSRVNESLPKQAAQLLYLYRRFGNGTVVGKNAVRENRLLVETLRGIGKEKLRFSPGLIGPILDAHREDIDWMEARLGASLAEDLSDSDGDIRREEDLLEVDPASVAALIDLIGDDHLPAGIRGETPEEVARLVGILREKLAEQHPKQRRLGGL